MSRIKHLLRLHWRLVLLVAILLILLPAVVAAEDEPAPAAAPPPTSEAEAAAPISEPGPPPFAVYREMIERPLFSSTRRPPVIRDAPQDNLDAQQLREVWRLTGIAMQQGRQLASLRERQGERRALLEVGMLLTDDWRLESIGSDYVQFSNGSSEVRMPLREPLASDETPSPAEARKARREKSKAAVPAQPVAPTDTTTPPVAPESAPQG